MPPRSKLLHGHDLLSYPPLQRDTLRAAKLKLQAIPLHDLHENSDRFGRQHPAITYLLSNTTLRMKNNNNKKDIHPNDWMGNAFCIKANAFIYSSAERLVFGLKKSEFLPQKKSKPKQISSCDHPRSIIYLGTPVDIFILDPLSGMFLGVLFDGAK